MRRRDEDTSSENHSLHHLSLEMDIGTKVRKRKVAGGGRKTGHFVNKRMKGRVLLHFLFVSAFFGLSCFVWVPHLAVLRTCSPGSILQDSRHGQGTHIWCEDLDQVSCMQNKLPLLYSLYCPSCGFGGHIWERREWIQEHNCSAIAVSTSACILEGSGFTHSLTSVC